MKSTNPTQIETGDTVEINADIAEALGSKVLIIQWKDGHQEVVAITTEAEGRAVAKAAYLSDHENQIEQVFSADRKVAQVSEETPEYGGLGDAQDGYRKCVCIRGVQDCCFHAPTQGDRDAAKLTRTPVAQEVRCCWCDENATHALGARWQDPACAAHFAQYEHTYPLTPEVLEEILDDMEQDDEDQGRVTA